jgi:hypothetical protein
VLRGMGLLRLEKSASARAKLAREGSGASLPCGLLPAGCDGARLTWQRARSRASEHQINVSAGAPRAYWSTDHSSERVLEAV